MAMAALTLATWAGLACNGAAAEAQAPCAHPMMLARETSPVPVAAMAALVVSKLARVRAEKAATARVRISMDID